MSCLSDATVVGWIEGRLSRDDRVAAEAHVAQCATCLELVGASRMLHSSGPSGDAAADDPEPLTATAPDQRYRIGVEIGAGGMGRVFECEDLALGRTVALKMVRNPSASLVARFRREVAIASMLQHPSIIPVYDAGTFSDGTAFCTMRLINGISLDEAIGSHDTVAERLGLVRAVISATDAMAYAHSRHIIHRDLKPQNIIIGPFGETIVLDWGLAKRLGDNERQLPTVASAQPGTTELGDVVGTRAYMAPEQLRGDSATKRSDVYALGLVLRQVIFGSLTEPRDQGAAALRRVPKELVAISERATCIDPGARYPSAAELADDLKRFATGQLVSAREYSRLVLVARWAKRRSGLLGAAFLLGLLVTGALISESLISEAKRDAEVSEETEREAQLARDFLGLFGGTAREKQLSEQRASTEAREQAASSGRQSPRAQRKLAAAYHEMGDTLFRTVIGDKDHQGALDNYEKALAIRRALVERAAGPSDVEKKELARTYDAIGHVNYDRYELEEALTAYRRANDASPTQARQRRVARIRYELGDNEGALRYHAVAVKHWQLEVRDAPTDTDFLRELSVAHGRVADILAAMGRTKEAIENYEASLAAANRADYVADAWKRALAGYQRNVGRLYRKTGDLDAARSAFTSCARLHADFGFSSNDAFDAATCSALAGDKDSAIQSLQTAFEGGWHNALAVENNPAFIPLHDDPRWRSLLFRMNATRPK